MTQRAPQVPAPPHATSGFSLAHVLTIVGAMAAGGYAVTMHQRVERLEDAVADQRSIMDALWAEVSQSRKENEDLANFVTGRTKELSGGLGKVSKRVDLTGKRVSDLSETVQDVDSRVRTIEGRTSGIEAAIGMTGAGATFGPEPISSTVASQAREILDACRARFPAIGWDSVAERSIQAIDAGRSCGELASSFVADGTVSGDSAIAVCEVFYPGFNWSKHKKRALGLLGAGRSCHDAFAELIKENVY